MDGGRPQRGLAKLRPTFRPNARNSSSKRFNSNLPWRKERSGPYLEPKRRRDRRLFTPKSDRLPTTSNPTYHTISESMTPRPSRQAKKSYRPTASPTVNSLHQFACICDVINLRYRFLKPFRMITMQILDGMSRDWRVCHGSCSSVGRSDLTKTNRAPHLSRLRRPSQARRMTPLSPGPFAELYLSSPLSQR
jgi:hypothetical protein